MQARQRVLLLVGGQIVAVPLAAHATGVVAQQGAFGVHQYRAAPGANVSKSLAEPLV